MDLLEALQVLVDNGLPTEAIVPIVNDLFKADSLEDDDDIKRLALLSARAEWEHDVDCDVQVDTYNDCLFCAGGNEYLVLTESERDEWWDNALENYLDECVEGADGPYFDREAWKRDARMDGAAHALSSYDGSEYEVDTFSAGEKWYYIYRTN